jgi:hypothetical protein
MLRPTYAKRVESGDAGGFARTSWKPCSRSLSLSDQVDESSSSAQSLPYWRTDNGIPLTADLECWLLIRFAQADRSHASALVSRLLTAGHRVDMTGGWRCLARHPSNCLSSLSCLPVARSRRRKLSVHRCRSICSLTFALRSGRATQTSAGATALPSRLIHPELCD